MFLSNIAQTNQNSFKTLDSPGVTIHGPVGCMKFMDIFRIFFEDVLDYKIMSHVASDGLFEDSCMTARHVPLTSNKTVFSPEPK